MDVGDWLFDTQFKIDGNKLIDSVDLVLTIS